MKTINLIRKHGSRKRSARQAKPAPSVNGLALMSRDIPTDKLEMAVIEAEGLLQLLADNMDYQSRSGCDFSGSKVETFCAGVAELVSQTNERLRNAFDEVFRAIYGTPEGAI